MPMPRGRRRLACHHEAGHCLARWFFGFHIDDAEVLSGDQIRSGVTIEDRRGLEVQCEGLVNGYDIHFQLPPELCGLKGADLDRYKADGIRRAEIALVELEAGVAAEARYRKRSAFACFLGGGQMDAQQGKAIAEAWLTEPGVGVEIATKRASALVGSPLGSLAIARVAEQLWARGRLDGEGIADLCKEVFGVQPPYDAWRDCWPPTLSQLRQGFIPGGGEAGGLMEGRPHGSVHGTTAISLS